jgi:hypothetical protein
MAETLNTRNLPKTREELEVLIEDLIARLDALDGCPDLEDCGDHEPWVSAQETGPGGQGSWGYGATDDREWDTADAEPWLGSVERAPEASQIGWAFSGDDDREEEVRRQIAPRRTRNGTQKPVLRVIDGGVRS